MGKVNRHYDLLLNNFLRQQLKDLSKVKVTVQTCVMNEIILIFINYVCNHVLIERCWRKNYCTRYSGDANIKGCREEVTLRI